VPAFATNVFSRPDATGVRGGIKRKELSRAGDFPYDREVSYGQPAAYDRGSQKVVPFRFNPERSPWDDVEEAIGTPYLLSKDAPGMGSSIPGNGRGWASPPNLEPDELDTLENGEEGHLRQEGAYFRTMTLNEAKRKKKSKKKEEKVPTWLRPYPETRGAGTPSPSTSRSPSVPSTCTPGRGRPAPGARPSRGGPPGIP
jgi:hypothetical protein